ncbi:MAG: hypothetical protein AVDCRST_MAG41-2893, partial [uncultured Corynebacteriales bacterium]
RPGHRDRAAQRAGAGRPGRARGHQRAAAGQRAEPGRRRGADGRPGGRRLRPDGRGGPGGRPGPARQQRLPDARRAGRALPAVPGGHRQPGRRPGPQHARPRPVRGHLGAGPGDAALAAGQRRPVRLRQRRAERGLALDLPPL